MEPELYRFNIQYVNNKKYQTIKAVVSKLFQARAKFFFVKSWGAAKARNPFPQLDIPDIKIYFASRNLRDAK